MRSLTFIQAVHYWVKLAAIAIPAVVLVWLWVRSGQPAPTGDWAADGGAASRPGSSTLALYGVYSTLLALCLGTMGLPHVVVRFYTNPDGRQARRTTVVVIGLLGIFYLFPPVYGALGRVYLPALPEGAPADTVVLLLPQIVSPGALGETLTAILAAGAFAAFLSTASGLTVAVAGVLDQDVVRPALAATRGGDIDGIGSFRLATVAATTLPCVLLLGVTGTGLAATVGLAFALTASTFCPLLVLGVWWRRLTPAGVGAGMTVGAVLALGAAVATIAGPASDGWRQALLSQPAAWTVPIAFLVTITVSLATPKQVPKDALRTLARLHTPESLGLSSQSR